MREDCLWWFNNTSIAPISIEDIPRIAQKRIIQEVQKYILPEDFSEEEIVDAQAIGISADDVGYAITQERADYLWWETCIHMVRMRHEEIIGYGRIGRVETKRHKAVLEDMPESQFPYLHRIDTLLYCKTGLARANTLLLNALSEWYWKMPLYSWSVFLELEENRGISPEKMVWERFEKEWIAKRIPGKMTTSFLMGSSETTRQKICDILMSKAI